MCRRPDFRCRRGRIRKEVGAAASPSGHLPFPVCVRSLDPRAFLMVILLTMSETRSLADVKAHLSEFVAQVGAQHDRVTVTVHGRPTAVLVAVDDLESLEETIAVLSNTDALRALAVADAELAAGRGESEAALRAAMASRRR